MNVLRLIGIVAFALLVCVSVASSAPPKVGDPVVDFELKALDGKDVKTAELRKDKVFLLKFGATWCGWCNRQIPELNKVVETYGDKVAVLDVDVRESAARVQKHVKAKGTKYLTVLDPTGAVARKYGVRGIPLVVVADTSGQVVFVGNYTKFGKLKEAIDPVLPKEVEAKPDVEE